MSRAHKGSRRTRSVGHANNVLYTLRPMKRLWLIDAPAGAAFCGALAQDPHVLGLADREDLKEGAGLMICGMVCKVTQHPTGCVLARKKLVGILACLSHYHHVSSSRR